MGLQEAWQLLFHSPSSWLSTSNIVHFFLANKSPVTTLLIDQQIFQALRTLSGDYLSDALYYGLAYQNLVLWNLQTISHMPLYSFPVFIRRKIHENPVFPVLGFMIIVTLKNSYYTSAHPQLIQGNHTYKLVSFFTHAKKFQDLMILPWVLQKVFRFLGSCQNNLVSMILGRCH